MTKNKLGVYTLGAALALGFATGCSDPSENVHKATTSTAQSATGSSTATAKEYVIRSDSKVGFVGSKVTGSHTGGFKNVAGTIKAENGQIVGTPEIKINLKSTWSDNDRLTGHLMSADFFGVDEHPVSTFTVTSIAPVNGKHQVTGNLNLHGVTKSITFPADISVSEDAVTVKAEFAINRREFNINYPGKPNDLIRDNVVITLDIKATPGPAQPEDQLTGV